MVVHFGHRRVLIDRDIGGHGVGQPAGQGRGVHQHVAGGVDGGMKVRRGDFRLQVLRIDPAVGFTQSVQFLCQRLENLCVPCCDTAA